MDWASSSRILTSLALGVALAACAGLRAWLPLLLAGAAARAGFIELSPHFAFVASDRALILFGVATLIEIAGDKVPAVDHVLDALGTVFRPAAGSILAAAVLVPIADPLAATALGAAVGVPSSLLPHAAKSALRATSTTLTGGLANPLLSLLEDLASLVFFVFAVLLPVLVAALVIVAAVLLIRRLRRRRTAPAPAR